MTGKMVWFNGTFLRFRVRARFFLTRGGRCHFSLHRQIRFAGPRHRSLTLAIGASGRIPYIFRWPSRSRVLWPLDASMATAAGSASATDRRDNSMSDRTADCRDSSTRLPVGSSPCRTQTFTGWFAWFHQGTEGRLRSSAANDRPMSGWARACHRPHGPGRCGDFPSLTCFRPHPQAPLICQMAQPAAAISTPKAALPARRSVRLVPGRRGEGHFGNTMAA